MGIISSAVLGICHDIYLQRTTLGWHILSCFDKLTITLQSLLHTLQVLYQQVFPCQLVVISKVVESLMICEVDMIEELVHPSDI